MKNIAIILSGGVGKRMNLDIPKQYMEIEGKPLLYYTIKAFQESFIDHIILVCGKDDIENCKSEYITKYGFNKIKAVVAGGKERYNSVINGLKAVNCNSDDNIYIHDGARPFVSLAILDRTRLCLDSEKACIVGVAVKDTIKIVDDNGYVVDTPKRDSLYMIQTPQAFKYELIIEAYNKLEDLESKGSIADLKITDDAMVVEHFSGHKVKIVAGEYENIKITSPEDIITAKEIIRERQL